MYLLFLFSSSRKKKESNSKMTTLKAKYSNLRDFKEDLYRFDSFD